MTHGRSRRRRLVAPEHRLGAAVLVAVAVTVVLTAFAARPLLSLLAEDGATPASAAPAAAPATFKDDMDLALARFRGRSIFFTPPPPPPPVVREPVERPPSGPPARYGGPALVAMIGDTAWFADGRRLVVGEDATGSDLRVIETSPPWYARVAWQGGEYTVTLFDRAGAASAVTTPTPPPAQTPAAPPASAASGAAQPPPEPPPENPREPGANDPEPDEPAPVPPEPDPEPGEPEPVPDPQPEPPSEPEPPQPRPQPEPQPSPATPQ